MLTFFLFGIVAEGQVSETRTVATFSKIDIKNAELIYMESDQNLVRIEAEDATALANVKTVMHGTTLKISNTGNAYDKVKVYVFFKNVAAFKGSANAKISLTDPLIAKDVHVALNSGATFTGNILAANVFKLTARAHTSFKGRIDTGLFEGNFNSNAMIILCGSARVAKIEAGTTAVCNAGNFVADNLSVNANDNSKVWIYGHKIIAINVSESAKVIYNGMPQQVNLNQGSIAYSKCKSDRYVSYNY